MQLIAARFIAASILSLGDPTVLIEFSPSVSKLVICECWWSRMS